MLWGVNDVGVVPANATEPISFWDLRQAFTVKMADSFKTAVTY